MNHDTTFRRLQRGSNAMPEVRLGVLLALGWWSSLCVHVVMKIYCMSFMLRCGCSVFSYAVPMCAAFSISLLLHSLQVFYAQTSGTPWRGSLCTAVSSFSTWNAFLRVFLRD